ncbi:MAG: TetR/AcrR family transcriptional regulator [Hyphomonas sp.]|nr:TetR/AcrR family transcriptional regulator [Hyphomonas sp.]
MKSKATNARSKAADPGNKAGSASRRRTHGKQAGRDTRQDIIEAAKRLFAEKGFDGTGMREIAKAAHVSLGLVTQFYHTKDELHRAVDAHVLGKFGRGIADIPDAHNFLEAGYRKTVDFVSKHQLEYRYIRRALVEDSPGSNEFFAHYHQLQIDVVRRAKRQGAIDADVDEIWAAFVLIFLSLGPIFCMNQIESIVGKSVFDVRSIEHRNEIYARLLNHGFASD